MNPEQKNKLRYIAIVGPTASGKTSLAYSLALKYNAEIINCDSVQLYKDFDIGSAKDTRIKEYPEIHHLFDASDWKNEWDASIYAQQAKQAIKEINLRQKLAIVVGGSGLYLRALMGENFHDLPFDPAVRAEIEKKEKLELYRQLKEVDPIRAEELHPNDKLRVVRALEVYQLSGKPMSSFKKKSTRDTPPLALFSLIPERSLLHQRIAVRTKEMLGSGLINEVQKLRSQGCPNESLPMRSIGYREVNQFLDGTIKADDLERKIIEATRQYAKRQCTWFSKLFENNIINAPSLEQAQKEVITVLSRLNL